MQMYQFLRSVDVLTDFDNDAIERLTASSFTQEVSQGQVVFAFGQHLETVGILVTGHLEARFPETGSETAPKPIAKGGLFGEISLLTGEPAMADIVAVTSSRVVHIPQEAITQEIGRKPKAAQSLARLLTKHLMEREQDNGPESRMSLASVTPDPIESHGGQKFKGPVLVLNLGSSSIKYALFDGGKRLLEGSVDRVGMDGSTIRQKTSSKKVDKKITAGNHREGLEAVFQFITHPEFGALARLSDLVAVGHRTVHGGTRFTEATVIDESVKEQLRRMEHLAPLHNPINLYGITICEEILPPGIPQVAVFDTAFHMSMPEHAYRYALPGKFADEQQLRRFGFHGTSHKYVFQTACSFLGQSPSAFKAITCHLGNGCSVTAIEHGRSVDTSMGLTPLEGLIMGTRSGDVDPGLILHLLGSGLDKDQIDQLLNKESGLLGLSGLSSDMRELQNAADVGHPGALLAIQSFCYRIRKYIGAYAAALGGFDLLVFTGGIGENGTDIRSRICHGLGVLGVTLDEERNRSELEKGARAKLISKEESAIKVLVVPTDEEGMIAEETVGALSRSGIGDILLARRDRPIPVGVSAHHVHLSREHVESLYGPGHTLTPAVPLFQPGQFACEEKVTLVGPKGTVERVRVLGPERKSSQVEISRTEEFKLGIDAPVRASGDTAGSPGITLMGSHGSVDLEEGVICALRHIHMSPEDALVFGLRDKDIVRVELSGERSLIFGDVLVRVNPHYKLEMHIDTDEANAAEVVQGMTASIESIQRRST